MRRAVCLESRGLTSVIIRGVPDSVPSLSTLSSTLDQHPASLPSAAPASSNAFQVKKPQDFNQKSSAASEWSGEQQEKGLPQ